MKKGVHSLVSRQLFGHRSHQSRIDNGQCGKSFRNSISYFFVGFGIGDNGPGVSLGSGARRSGNSNNRQHFFGDIFILFYIIPVGSGIANHYRNGLGGIDGAAATQADNEVAIGVSGEFRRFHNVFFNRIGQNFIKNLGINALSRQQSDDPVQITEVAHRASVGDDDKSFSSGHGEFG